MLPGASPRSSIDLVRPETLQRAWVPSHFERRRTQLRDPGSLVVSSRAMKPPRLSGAALTAARIAAETPGTDAAVREIMKRSVGIDQLATLPEAWRDELPLDARPLQAAEARRWGHAGLGAMPVRAWPRPAAAYAAAFREGRTTPRKIAERALRALDALAERRPCMNIAVARDSESTLREADAAPHPIGLLDGV